MKSPAYVLERPESLSGVGSLIVYRAISRESQPLLQTPMLWARQQAAFTALTASPEPATAAQLHASGVPLVPKIWTELAYESVRVRVARTLPSRLDSLFAFTDPLEAFSLEQITSNDKDVYQGVVQDGVAWCIVDMAHFGIPSFQTFNPEGYQSAWDVACGQAARYWNPTGPIETAEALVAGPVLLQRSALTLVDLLRHMGIVA